MHPLFANFIDNAEHVYDFMKGMAIGAQNVLTASLDEELKKVELGRLHHINAARHHIKLAVSHIKALEADK